MKSGFTTGTAATGAAKAYALFALTKQKPEKINITLPCGSNMELPVFFRENSAFVIKDSGTDPDVTHGAEIHATVELNNSGIISITGGEGVGIVTKAGLQIAVGMSAINPVPMKMIEENVREVIGYEQGANVIVSVPEGIKLAEKTFNERIGIIGGISIIGTTGIVHPMSVDALIDSFKCEINVRLAENSPLIFVPGKIGEKHLQTIMPQSTAVMVSNYFGDALKYAVSKDVKKITIAGHPGKLAKLAMGYYNTHSAESPQAQDFVASSIGIDSTFNTVEEICLKYPESFDIIAEKINKKIKADFKFTECDILLFNMKGDLIGRFKK